MEYPEASVDPNVVSDLVLWDEAGQDPAAYVAALRKQGRVGPQQTKPIAILKPQPRAGDPR